VNQQRVSKFVIHGVPVLATTVILYNVVLIACIHLSKSCSNFRGSRG
jgi:hypothetical protein